ncbi:MAG: hypothetical protein JRN08_03620 [Nitrososphaerota archaeon]|nr:hypothetical protein [Nitrososphaerota archaeon]
MPPQPGARGSRKWLYMVVAVVLVVVGAVGIYGALSSGSPMSSGYSPYANSTAGVTMNYPSGWSVVKQLVMTFQSPDQGAVVGVADLGVTGGETNAQASDALMSSFQGAYSDFHLVANGTTTVNGASAIQFSFTFSDKELTVTTVTFCGHFYNIDYAVLQSSQSTYLANYQAMLGSFHVSGC